MKIKFILWLAITLGVMMMFASNSFAEPQFLPPLRVVIIPSTTNVRIREPFSLALLVENPTKTNQVVRVMNCAWRDEWQPNNPKVPWGHVECTKNFAINVTIPPGGAYSNETSMEIYNLIPDKELSFRMGFTSIGSTNTFWSNEVKLHILSPDKKP
jgi:hypothetical protein